MEKPSGEIILVPGVNVRPHELRTAEALARTGRTVRFIKKSDRPRETTPDALVDGIRWEFKSPTSGKLSSVRDNLRKGLHQCDRIVLDSRRMKVPDYVAERELAARAREFKSLRGLLFIDRHGGVKTIL